MGLKFDIGRPGEHWLGNIEIVAGDGLGEDAAVSLGDMLLSCYPPYMDDIPELRMTPAERASVVVMMRAINRIRAGLGLEGIRVSSGRVHVLDDTEYLARFGRGQGYSRLGHVYIMDHVRSVLQEWALVLSHELTHLSSFIGMRVSVECGESGTMSDIGLTRQGLFRTGSDGRDAFMGLNEVVTDYVAMLVRRDVAKTRGRMARPCRETRDEIRSYVGQCELVFGLCRRMAASSATPWNHQRDVWTALLIDYWTGSDVFLDVLATVDPEFFRLLKDLGTDQEDAVVALELLKRHLS